MSCNLTLRTYRRVFTLQQSVNFRCALQRTLTTTCSTHNNATATLPPLNVATGDADVVDRQRPKVTTTTQSGNADLVITTLPNGMKVTSDQTFGPFCTVGVLIDAGSRYEVDYPSGISHMLEKLAYQSTRVYTDCSSIMQKMESLGGQVDCQIAKDITIYAASAFKYNLEGAMEVLSEATLRANISPEEVEEQKQTILYELDSLKYALDCDIELNDLIHAAAFNGNTMGLPKLCPEENLSSIDADVLKHYIERYYRPDRITIAGVNVDHNELLRHVDTYFTQDGPASWQCEAVAPDRSIAQYTGGLLTDHRDEPRVQSGIQDHPELVHVAIGFESANYTDPDMYAFAVLNTLLGGGGSFSAGGPGKGMYSRLYTNVLNRYHWMYASTAFNHAYADSGLFCIHSSAPPQHINDIVSVVTGEYMKLATLPFDKTEVARAKKQTQSMLMMNLESRVVKFEDLGRQVLGLGARKSPQELYASIECVTADDLRRVAERMLCRKPSVAAVGDCSSFKGFGYVEKCLFQQRSFTSRLFGR